MTITQRLQWILSPDNIPLIQREALVAQACRELGVVQTMRDNSFIPAWMQLPSENWRSHGIRILNLTALSASDLAFEDPELVKILPHSANRLIRALYLGNNAQTTTAAMRLFYDSGEDVGSVNSLDLSQYPFAAQMFTAFAQETLLAVGIHGFPDVPVSTDDLTIAAEIRD